MKRSSVFMHGIKAKILDYNVYYILFLYIL